MSQHHVDPACMEITLCKFAEKNFFVSKSEKFVKLSYDALRCHSLILF